LDKSLVDFPHQSFSDRSASFQILRDEIKGPPIVQQFPHIVGVGVGDRISGQQTFGLVEGQARSLDMGGVVGFQDQGSTAHLPYPGFGSGRALQKTRARSMRVSPAAIPFVIMNRGWKCFVILPSLHLQDQRRA